MRNADYYGSGDLLRAASLRRVIVFVVLLNFSLTSPAVTKTWGGASGDFNTASNWSPSGVLGVNDDVIINATGTYTVSLSASSTINSINVKTTRYGRSKC